MRKKGQLEIGNAPTIVLLVGLTFLVMATVALIGQKYGAAIPSDNAHTTINETLTTVTEAGEYVANRTNCNFDTFAVTLCINSSSATVIPSSNYTAASTGLISTKTGTEAQFNNTDWKCTYTFTDAGVACNINTDLQEEIENNTSIAGIVLTISLVGIVLSILVGVFLGIGGKARRV